MVVCQELRRNLRHMLCAHSCTFITCYWTYWSFPVHCELTNHWQPIKTCFLRYSFSCQQKHVVRFWVAHHCDRHNYTMMWKWLPAANQNCFFRYSSSFQKQMGSWCLHHCDIICMHNWVLHNIAIPIHWNMPLSELCLTSPVFIFCLCSHIIHRGRRVAKKQGSRERLLSFIMWMT